MNSTSRRINRSATVLATLALATSSGCASILSKSVYPVSIQSQPNNAQFVIKDHRGESIATGMTPQTVPLSAKRGFFRPAEYTISYSVPGQPSVDRNIRAGMDGFVFGNILLGGIPGLVVDAGTGAMFDLPDSVSGSLSGGAAYSQNESPQSSEAGEIQPVGFTQE